MRHFVVAAVRNPDYRFALHRHSGAGRNPEPRRCLGVSRGGGVDSRFRGNDGMGGGNGGRMRRLWLRGVARILSRSSPPHRHSGVGRNPEPRRCLGVATGGGVDSRFRGNDGMGAGTADAGRDGLVSAIYPAIPPPFALRQAQGERRLPPHNPAAAWGVDSRFRGNDGMGAGMTGWCGNDGVMGGNGGRAVGVTEMMMRQPAQFVIGNS